LNIETANALDVLRVATNDLLNEQKVTAARVVTIDIFDTPARILSFKLYGDSNRGKEISDLNEEINLSYLDGTVKVLTDDNG